MKATAPYAVIGIGVIIMAFIAWWFGFRNTETPEEPAPQEPTIELSEGLSIYTNGEHGFLLTYPEGASVAETFNNPWLPNAWSATADPDNVGTPIVSITTYRTESDHSYPRHYTTLVRVGASNAVASCLSARTDRGETALPDVTWGGETFKVFSFGDAGMMRYVKGVSYRIVKGDRCYAIEQIAAGSTYREESSPEDIPDATLEAQYDRLSDIVSSFQFVR